MTLQTITIQLPADVFDTEGATVQRQRRISVQRMDDLKGAGRTPAELYQQLAELLPAWAGVLDCETGQPLENPSQDPAVLGRLDAEQLGWLSECLTFGPKKLRARGLML